MFSQIRIIGAYNKLKFKPVMDKMFQIRRSLLIPIHPDRIIRKQEMERLNVWLSLGGGNKFQEEVLRFSNALKNLLDKYNAFHYYKAAIRSLAHFHFERLTGFFHSYPEIFHFFQNELSKNNSVFEQFDKIYQATLLNISEHNAQQKYLKERHNKKSQKIRQLDDNDENTPPCNPVKSTDTQQLTLILQHGQQRFFTTAGQYHNAISELVREQQNEEKPMKIELHQVKQEILIQAQRDFFITDKKIQEKIIIRKYLTKLWNIDTKLDNLLISLLELDSILRSAEDDPNDFYANQFSDFSLNDKLLGIKNSLGDKSEIQSISSVEDKQYIDYTERSLHVKIQKIESEIAQRLEKFDKIFSKNDQSIGLR